MSSRTANSMTAIGAVMALLGLCVLPAAFGKHPDTALLGAGLSFFSLGLLTVAMGVYLKAKAAKSGAPPPKEEAKKRLKNGCDLCQIELPVILCKVHELHLCPVCLERHYDMRSCNYVPSPRSATAKGARSMTARSRG